MEVPVWDIAALIRHNLERFSPPKGSRRRATFYSWGGIEEGAAGLVSRMWTKKLQRVLLMQFDPEYPIVSHYDVASTVDEESPYFIRWGQLDVGGFHYQLMNTFRQLRASVFDILIEVVGCYDDEYGDEWKASYVVKTQAKYPLYTKCNDDTRLAYYAPDVLAGSHYTDPSWGESQRKGEPMKYVRRGRRSRRLAAHVGRLYDNPPDIFWLVVYGVWYAMERIIEELQDKGGRTYLERKTRIFFTIREIQVIQSFIDPSRVE
jgi:hypothetical protein